MKLHYFVWMLFVFVVWALDDADADKLAAEPVVVEGSLKITDTTTTQEEGETDDKKEAAEAPPMITIFTGTHAPPAAEAMDSSTQSVQCQGVNEELRNVWTAFNDVKKYIKAKNNLAAALSMLLPGDKCVFASTPKHYLYTFPMAMKSTAMCNRLTKKTLTEKKYVLGWDSVEASTRVTVPWFLIRPDLVTLDKLANHHEVKLRYFVSLGHDVETAALSREGCPRFNTILNKREIYKQRLLHVAISDLNHQLNLIQHAQVVVNVCTDSLKVQSKLHFEGNLAEESINMTMKAHFMDHKMFSDSRLACPKSINEVSFGKLTKSHIPSILANDFFHGHMLKKTVFATKEDKIPTLAFVAGIEGTGHHMFSLMGRQHTTRPLYEALTDYLCNAAWKDDSWDQYAVARDNLVSTMRGLSSDQLSSGDNVFFLNTVYSEAAVNMYSYPWGGPRCYLKKFARVVCNIDLYELAKMAEDAGIDFRVIVLKRAVGAAVVSSSINRNFGTFISQTRLLGLSSSLLQTSLKTVDPAFYETFLYEDLIQFPKRSTERLNKHLNVPPESQLGQQLNTTLHNSQRDYGHKNIHSWKAKVGVMQFSFLSDLLYFSDEEKLEWQAQYGKSR